MREVRKYLITALISAINAKTTGLTVYTKVPKNVSYPFVYITNISDTENGPKNSYFYEYELDVEIVYKDLTDKTVIWDTANLIKNILCNGVPFYLSENFEIMQATLGTTNENETLLNSQEVDTIVIGMSYLIEDKN